VCVVTGREPDRLTDAEREEIHYRGFALGWKQRGEIASAEERDRILIWLAGWQEGARAGTRGVAKSGWSR
jgi:hypothetical protein